MRNISNFTKKLLNFSVFMLSKSNSKWLASRTLSLKTSGSHMHFLSNFAKIEPMNHSMKRYSEIEFKTADGMFLAGKRWGNSTGLPILALHGWMDNANSFDKLAPELAEAGCNVVCLDFPGHGLSAHRSIDAVYDICDYAFYAMEAARFLGWERFSLLGHSLGAVVSSMIAGALPSMVDKCVLIEALGPLSYDPADAATHLRKHLQARGHFLRQSQQSKRKNYENIEAAVDARLKTVESLPGNQSLSREAARCLVLRSLKPSNLATSSFRKTCAPDLEALSAGPVSFIHDTRLTLVSPSYFTEEQACAFIEAIECPVLLIRASNGWPEKKAFKNRLELIKDKLQRHHLVGGHHLHLDLETYQEVNSIVRAFLFASKLQAHL